MMATLCALAGGSSIDASMSFPAKSLRLALFALMAAKLPWQQFWLCLVASVVRAAIAAKVCEFLRPEELAREGHQKT